MAAEDIVYIVIGIVMFIVSLLGKKKKQNPIVKNEDLEETEYSLNDFEKILERTKMTEQEFEFNEEEAKKAEEPIDHVSKNYHFTENEATTENDNLRKEKKKHKEILDNEDDESENEDGFDLKTAIVYSSILERKKFRH